MRIQCPFCGQRIYHETCGFDVAEVSDLQNLAERLRKEAEQPRYDGLAMQHYFSAKARDAQRQLAVVEKIIAAATKKREVAA